MGTGTSSDNAVEWMTDASWRCLQNISRVADLAALPRNVTEVSRTRRWREWRVQCRLTAIPQPFHRLNIMHKFSIIQALRPENLMDVMTRCLHNIPEIRTKRLHLAEFLALSSANSPVLVLPPAR